MADPASHRLCRLLEMAGYLALRGGITTSRQISGAFDISVRTVYRDVEGIRVLGLPIEGEAGTGYAVKREAFVEWLVGKTLRNARSRIGHEEQNLAERRLAKHLATAAAEQKGYGE